MTPNIVRKPEQIKLIMECRQSGLSDYQWCKAKDINPGTFYNWVSKLRKSGYTFPESKSKSTGVPTKQDVVKLDLIGHGIPAPVMAEQNISSLSLPAAPNAAAEIQYGSITLRIFNGADLSVVQSAIQCVGGMPNAW